MSHTDPDHTVPLVDAAPWQTDARAIQAFAEEWGYVFVRGLLDREHVDAAARFVRARCAEAGWVTAEGDPVRARPGARLTGTGHDDPSWLALQGALFVRPEVQALAEDAALHAVLAALYGGPPERHRGDVCRIGLPHSRDLTTPPHQDLFYVKREVALWVAWMPLVPVPLELGPLAVWPGSHRVGLRPHLDAGPRLGIEVPDDAEWAVSALEPGDVLLFHGLTVHRAWHNTTDDGVRLSLDFRFLPSDPA